MQKSYSLLLSFFLFTFFSVFSEVADKELLIKTLANEKESTKIESALLSFFTDQMASNDLTDVYQYLDHIASEDNKVHLLSWPKNAEGNNQSKLILLQANDGKLVTNCRILDLQLGIDEFTPAVPSGIFAMELLEGPHYLLQFSGTLEEEESQYHIFQLYDEEGFVLCKSCMAHEAELIIEKPVALDLKIQVMPKIGRIVYQDYEWHKRKNIFKPSEQIQYKLVSNVFLKVK